MLLFGGLEDQPRALEAVADRLAPPAGHHAHEPIALAGEVLERLNHLIAVQHEDHPVLHRQLFDGFASRLLRPHRLGQEPLPLRSFGPQPATALVCGSLQGGVPPAPIFQVLFDPVQHSLYGGRMTLAHHQPPLSVYRVPLTLPRFCPSCFSGRRGAFVCRVRPYTQYRMWSRQRLEQICPSGWLQRRQDDSPLNTAVWSMPVSELGNTAQAGCGPEPYSQEAFGARAG